MPSSNDPLIMHNYNSLKRYLSTANKYDDDTGQRVNMPGLQSSVAYDSSAVVETKYSDVISTRCTSVPAPRSFRMISHEPVITSNINQNLPTSGDQPPKYDAHHAYQAQNLSSYQFNAVSNINFLLCFITWHYRMQYYFRNVQDAADVAGESLLYTHHPAVDVSQLPPPPEYHKAISEPPRLAEETEKLCISEPDIIGRIISRFVSQINEFSIGIQLIIHFSSIYWCLSLYNFVSKFT